MHGDRQYVGRLLLQGHFATKSFCNRRPLGLVKILKVERQVVAGLNFRMEIEVAASTSNPVPCGLEETGQLAGADLVGTAHHFRQLPVTAQEAS